MSQAQKIQKELDELMANLHQVKSDNTVDNTDVVVNQGYTYRASPAIKASDIGPL